MAPRRSLLFLAALALAAAKNAAALSSDTGKLSASEEQAVRSHEADYAHFAELVATVMIVREGGVDAAMEAVPILHDSTDAYISALALGANSATNSTNLLGKDWAGLSDAAAALIAKNYTRLAETDPLRFKAAGDALGAKLNNTKLPVVDAVGDKLLNEFNNGGQQRLSALADVATFGKASDAALIQSLNDQFGKYNVEFTGKSIAPPSRFSNAAAVITRAITGVSLSATAINFAPCLVSISPTVASASFEAINVQPQGIATTLRFATYNAQGVNIQPGLIIIGPQGTNVQPQGAQVSPFLIAVSPLGANVQPQGFVHGPTDISVSSVGALNSPRGYVYAPVSKIVGGRTAVDLTPPKPPAGNGKKLLAADEAAAAAADAAAAAAFAAATKQGGGGDGADSKKLVVSDDPLDLSKDFPLDYRNWAAVLSQVLMTKEGNSAEAAKASLQRLMLAAHGHLAKVASGEELVPRFHLQDPVLGAASASGSPFPTPPFLDPNAPKSAFPATSVTAFSSSSTFFNYAPCVLSETPTGASASITGLNFIPSLFSLSAIGFEADTTLINIQPQLIYLFAKVNQVEPQGFSVQPGLIYVGPIAANVQPQGASFQPTGINVSPDGAVYQPVGAAISPTRIAVGDVGVGYTPHAVDGTPGTTADDGLPVGGL